MKLIVYISQLYKISKTNLQSMHNENGLECLQASITCIIHRKIIMYFGKGNDPIRTIKTPLYLKQSQINHFGFGMCILISQVIIKILTFWVIRPWFHICCRDLRTIWHFFWMGTITIINICWLMGSACNGLHPNNVKMFTTFC